MKSKKLSKFDFNLIYISLFITFILGIGGYFLFQKFFEPKFTILPIETDLDKKLNKEIAEMLEKEKNENLFSKEWVWVRTEIGSAQKITPFGREFVLKISPEGNFTSSTDCNNLIGNSIVLNNKIYFRDFGQTKKFCPKSREVDYTSNLEDVVKFRFDEKRRLILDLKDNSGFMVFEAK